MNYRALSIALAFGAIATPLAAFSQDEPTPLPGPVAALAACRAEQDNSVKAACYDAQLDQLIAAIESGDLVAVSKSEIEEAREMNFGLPSFRMPNLTSSLFGGDGDEPEPELRILHIVEVSTTGSRKLRVVTDDGQVWLQAESRTPHGIGRPPFDAEVRPAMGSTYFVRLNGRPAVRMERVQ